MIDYLLLDVFTDRAYTGNPLAVVLDADGLSEAAMATIANELNLSETVFLGRPNAEGAWPTRIFTPAVELPFAGHPTVGAAIALAQSARLEPDGVCVLAERVGDVFVEVERGDRAGRARFRVPRTPENIGVVGRDLASHLAGLTPSDLDDDIEPTEWSAGVPFVVVTVRDLACMARTTPSSDAEHLYVIAPVDGPPPTATTWRARMFAPAMGIAEDPATGAAAAATAGLLASIDTSGDARRTWTIEQGVEMGRPSRIDVTIERDDLGELTAVLIGGSAVVVGRGQLAPPAAPDPE
jgi:trans-2,3-dihydro-3-hydroxyanthranilate isomerase